MERIAAKVDGAVISIDEVAWLATESGITPAAALDALIRNELLVAEARRRGYDFAPDVAAEQRMALAGTLLKRQIGDAMTVNDVPAKLIADLYEARRETYDHGPERRVVHLLYRVGPGFLPESEAQTSAAAFAARAATFPDEAAFRAAAQQEVARLPGDKARVEDLFTFARETKRLEESFVQGAFVPAVGRSSVPVKSSYGWHVIFVIEELPERHTSLAEAEAELAREILPSLQAARAGELLEGLNRKGSFFIYEQSLTPEGSPQ